MSIVSEHTGDDRTTTEPGSLLVYRQKLAARTTHWIWAICLFFLLLSGLQIFSARPTLYVRQQSGFGFDNLILSMSAEDTKNGPKGYTTIFGHRFNTSGLLDLIDAYRPQTILAYNLNGRALPVANGALNSATR